MAMPLTPVTSSQIAAVGYDPASRELVIRFYGSSRRQEPVYFYYGVPPELAWRVIDAGSPGSYFHRHIRRGRYPCRRNEGDGLRPNEPLRGEAWR